MSRAAFPLETRPTGRARVAAYVHLLRAYQWTKNLAVLAPVIFSFNLLEASVITNTIVAIVSFSAASSSVYTVNDIIDADSDQRHPTKRFRPIASGLVDKRAAAVFATGLVLVALGAAWIIAPLLSAIVATYWIINLAYSMVLKSVVIVDIMSIALGFVLRVVGGNVVADTIPSSWLLLVAFFLALFLAVGKRRQEVRFLAGEGQSFRQVLSEYDRTMLDQAVGIFAGLVVVGYSLFTISPYAVDRFGSTYLIYTVPFVVYGVFRYLYLMYKQGEGEDPAALLAKDRPIIACVVLWGLASVAIVYGDRFFTV